MNNVLPRRWESLVFLNVPSSSVWQGPGWQVSDSTSLIHEFRVTMHYIFMQMQVHFGSFFPCKTIMEALRAFALVNMGREVFTAKTFSPRECDVFFFWLRINRSSGINRRIERCERPQAPESLIGEKEMPLFCEVSLRFRVNLFCHSTTQGYMAKCNWYSLYATWEKLFFWCMWRMIHTAWEEQLGSVQTSHSADKTTVFFLIP